MDILSEAGRIAIKEYIDANRDRIDINSKIFDIMEGSLSPHLLHKLREDLGQKSYEQAKGRIAPINYYRKVVDKMTTIYNQGVVRKVTGGTDADQELVGWYETELGLNKKLNKNNETLNAYQYALMQVTLTEEKANGSRLPFVRTIPNSEYLVMSTSKVDPTSDDVVILFMGARKDAMGKDEYVYHVYTDEQFVIINGKGDILRDLMAANDMDGTNPYGVKPFQYVNMSENLVMPKLQVDDVTMALLIPLLLTDLNYAVKFQAFSIWIFLDVEAQGIEISPNSILSLKSDATGEKPSVDVAKPAVDIAEVLNLAASQVGLWLSSKGIRPGSVGNVGADSFSSGISKMIDESDTYESRKEQIAIYKDFEASFWDKLLKVLHPQWVAGGLIDNRTIFSPSAEVVTEFQNPQPLKTRMELISELKEAIDVGLESKVGALKELHPEWDEVDIEVKLLEIEQETQKAVERMMGGAFGGGRSNEGEDTGSEGFDA